jgi:hypothetical protein
MDIAVALGDAGGKQMVEQMTESFHTEATADTVDVLSNLRACSDPPCETMHEMRQNRFREL